MIALARRGTATPASGKETPLFAGMTCARGRRTSYQSFKGPLAQPPTGIGAQHLEPPVLITLPKNQVLHEILWDWCHLRELIEIYPFLQRSKKCPATAVDPPHDHVGKYLLTVINPSATVQLYSMARTRDAHSKLVCGAQCDGALP